MAALLAFVVATLASAWMLGGWRYYWHRCWSTIARCLCACRRRHPLYEDPEVISMKKLPPHSPLRLLSLATVDPASTFRLGGNRLLPRSEWVHVLDSDDAWLFSLVRQPGNIGSSVSAACRAPAWARSSFVPDAGWRPIRVPGCWQTQGWGQAICESRPTDPLALLRLRSHPHPDASCPPVHARRAAW